MSDDIHLMIEALESYTGLPWDYLKIAHPFIEKLFKRCAGIISRDDLIEISKTICDRCTMGDKLCDATMNLLSAQAEERTKERTGTHACDCIGRQAAIDAIDKCSVWVMYTQGDSQKDEAEFVESIIKQTKKAIQSMLIEDLPCAEPEQTASNFLQSLPTSPLLVRKMPTAQPEIIRCKDCKFYREYGCQRAFVYPEPEDFCSRAERREG